MLIRKKILCSTVLLTATLLLLMYCSLRGVYAYRNLSTVISQLARELQATSDIHAAVDDLKHYSRRIDNGIRSEQDYLRTNPPGYRHQWFRQQLNIVDQRLVDYEKQLESHLGTDPLLFDRRKEMQLVADIRTIMGRLTWTTRDGDSTFVAASSSWVEEDLIELSDSVRKLPSFLLERMRQFRGEVRNRYRALIAVIALSSVSSLFIVGVSFWFFRHSVVQPFKKLLEGSRSIARGEFEKRIEIESHDEIAELASALNRMTDLFVEIRNNLNEKVEQRTREVVRSEQLASVGFLAAGVAHEINNPLASIAWSAEALESRLHDLIHASQQTLDPQTNNPQPNSTLPPEETQVLGKYLRRIQDEAFRCKGITERLLDFSRLGESQRKQPTDIHQSITDVIALVKHLGQYRNKSIELRGTNQLIAEVSQTEFKQVVLNLLTNALDASEDGDTVVLELDSDDDFFYLTVVDKGCGMSDEVLNHLFEPFFTRRRDGRGTGLGLSITYRIVQDHGGSLLPHSPGPGQGSTFKLQLPLNDSRNQIHERRQAA